MSAQAVYEFGDIRVDLGRAQLLRGGRVVAVEPKTFDVLRFLLENRDRLVTKEELLDSVWAGTFVTPNALTRAVAQLRKALGDDAREARYVETVARRGYRFIAPVKVPGEPASESPVAAPDTAPHRRIPRIATAAIPVVLIAALVALPAIRKAAMRDADRTATPAAPQLDRVTTRLGYNSMPSVSPDGSRVAYVSDESGALEIHVTGMADGSSDVAITNDGGQNTYPAWSPDGEWIAFHSRKRHGIWVVPSTGGVPVQIADFGSVPAWAPDSKTLVFSSDAGGMAIQAQLWTVARDGSALRPLTRLGAPSGGHHSPVWSHNGRWVVFTVYQDLVARPLFAVDVQSGKVTRLLNDMSFTPVISPHDDAILFVELQDAHPVLLMRMPVDPASGTPTGPPVVVRELPSNVEQMSFATDGTLVVGLSEYDTNLWAVDLNGTETREPVRLTQSAIRAARPAYSRDGRIAYVAAEGKKPSTWIINGDGSGRQALIIDRPNGGPMWAPDGKRLLIRYDPNPPEERFWWVDLLTRRLTPTGIRGKGIEYAHLSPSGDEIAYHAMSKDGVLNVWRQTLDGKTRRQVTFDREAATYPSWSPDGKRLAIELKRGETTNVAVVGRDGGPLRLVTSAHGQSWPHSWSPDGRWIAFAGEREGVWNVYCVSPDSLETRQLTHFTSVEGYVRYPAWSPDGRRIVFERSILRAGIWRMKMNP